MAAKLPMPFGAYALLKSLGQGAMGDIHLARPFNPRRGVPTPIVIKRLHGELASNADFVRRFKHEAEIAVSVDSPHVAKVYDVGAVGETLYIAMEHVNGWPVSKFIEAIIASGHHANISAVVDLIAGGLVGLEALHTAKDVRTGQPLGVVHRDISPKNLMVGEDGSMRLIDLGLGKSNVQDWKTRTGVVMGSVGYMPPEQVTAERIDHRADLYAMGAVLFELLALRHYIPRGAIPVMLRNSVAPVFEPPSKYRPDVPKGLDEVLRKALALAPDDRYQSAAEFLTAIRQVVPERRSAGGMVSLIGDLFATSLPERKSELSQLLRAPLPELPEDGPPPEHTVTFVLAEGVAPLAPEDLPRTRVVGMDEVQVSPATARTGPRVEIVPTPSHTPRPPGFMTQSQPEYLAPMPDAALYTGIPSGSLPATPATAAVPMWVLGVAVVAALGVGAFATVAFRGNDDEPTVVGGREISVIPAAPMPVGVRPAVAAPEPTPTAEATTPPPPPTATPREPNPSAQRRSPASPPPPNPVAPPPTSTPEGTPAARLVDVSPEAVRTLADALMTRTQKARDTVTDPDQQKALMRILTGITMEAASTNPEQAMPRLRSYERQLDALE